MNISWDADKYTSDFSFVHQYGNSVMELIDADMQFFLTGLQSLKGKMD